MKLLLIISIFIFCFIISKINKKSISNSILITLAATFTPIILLGQFTPKILTTFIISLLLLTIFDLTKNRNIKKFLFIVSLLYLAFIILFLTNIINSNLEVDIQRLFFINDQGLETIRKFQRNALYLPKILRPLIYNPLQIISTIFVRTLNYLWIDKIINYFGFSFIYLGYLAFTKKKNLYLLALFLIIVLSGVLHRDPNNYLIYLYSLPVFLFFFIKTIDKLKPSILFLTLLISCFYSYL